MIMFEKLKKVDNVLFWLVVVAACAWVVLGLLAGGFVGLLVGLALAGVCFLEYYIAGLFYYIGVDKGYNGKVYLWVGVFLTVIGYLLIVAMPDRGSNPQFANEELPDL